MSWAPKRFWKAATVAPLDGAWTVTLDGRPVKTPAKSPLHLPTEALAEAVAAEWEAQQGEVKPTSMPFTRMANSAIDKVAPMTGEVVAYLVEYAGSDLLCYRAENPAELVRRQLQAWDPLLDWLAQAEGARLSVTTGIIHVTQPAPALQALAGAIADLSPFRLAAFHDLVTIPGSFVLALAVMRGQISPQTAWDLSRIDETFQIEQWGHDEEAAELAAFKRLEFLGAARFFALGG